MEIDAGRQEATVGTLEAQRAAREADLAYWKQQTARLRSAARRRRREPAGIRPGAATLRSGEAQLSAIDQQIREQRVELGYHRVRRAGSGRRRRHPGAAWRAGHPATVLTTIDDNQGLEVYLQVPVQQAPT